MARWGEGDPRWIVEERPDATNVNNWHWTEKNASEWSRGKLSALFLNLELTEVGLGTVTITEVSKCEGEAMANNRKGKLIFFYEWVLELQWKGNSEADPDNDIKGKIDIPNLSEEHQPHEVDVTASVASGGEEGDRFKEFIRLKGLKTIHEKIAEYIQALKDEYASDLILPTKAQSVTKQSRTLITQDLANNVKNITMSCPSEEKDPSGGVKFHTTTVTLSQSFKCTADEIYNVFTVKEMVCAFTRNDVKLNPEKGGKFELFGGNVSGEFVELIPREKIIQKWRFKSWPSNHHSQVELTFSQEEDATRVDLKQTGIPINDVERTKLGWQNYYWEGIKRTFGFGALLT